MAGYTLKITDASGKEINLTTYTPEDADDTGDDIITDAVFKMNMLDDSSKTRGDNVRAELTVKGKITKNSKEDIQKLAAWSIESNNERIYRTVTLEVNEEVNGSGDILRNYTLENMYVIDYTESFNVGGESEKGEYELFLGQKDCKGKKDVSAV